MRNPREIEGEEEMSTGRGRLLLAAAVKREVARRVAEAIREGRGESEEGEYEEGEIGSRRPVLTAIVKREVARKVAQAIRERRADFEEEGPLQEEEIGRSGRRPLTPE